MKAPVVEYESYYENADAKRKVHRHGDLVGSYAWWGKRYNISPGSAKSRILRSRPMKVTLTALYCIGRPDGDDWLEVSAICGEIICSRTFVQLHTDNGVFHWCEPDRLAQSKTLNHSGSNGLGDEDDIVRFPEEGESGDPLLAKFASLRFTRAERNDESGAGLALDTDDKGAGSGLVQEIPVQA